MQLFLLVFFWWMSDQSGANNKIRVKRALHCDSVLTNPSLLSVPASVWMDEDIWSVFSSSWLSERHLFFALRCAEGWTGERWDDRWTERPEEAGRAKNIVKKLKKSKMICWQWIRGTQIHQYIKSFTRLQVFQFKYHLSCHAFVK